jgi:hypothetical protein
MVSYEFAAELAETGGNEKKKSLLVIGYRLLVNGN